MLAVSASNVARSNVPGATPDRVTFEDDKDGGVKRSRVTRPSVNDDEMSTMKVTGTSKIDQSHEGIYQIIGKNSFGANVELAKASLGMYAQMLNLHV